MALLKKEDIAQLSTEELVAEIKDRQKILWEKKFYNSISALENVSEIKFAKREVARLKTELRKRELEAKSEEK